MSTPTTDPPKTPFSVLRPDVWSTLSSRLDTVESAAPILSLVREQALRPLQLLDAMAVDAPAGLGDDFFAAERLRALLYLAGPWRALPAEAAQLAASGPAAQPYQPGVLHHGKLVIVGLAAVRVAPSAAGAADLLATVHGLALALSAVEVLGRLEPGGPGGAALEALLRTLGGLGDVPGHPSASLLRPFVFDAVERGRWACLAELFGGDALGSFVRDRLQAEKGHTVLWDAARSDGISAVDPASAAPGARVLLRGHFDEAGPKKTKDADPADVVFASESSLCVAEALRRSKNQISVVVPREAKSGWIGFSNPTAITASNRYRKSVRDFWSGLTLPTVAVRPPGFLTCLREAPVPVEWIPNLGRRPGSAQPHALSSPPRTATNRFVASDRAEVGGASADSEAGGLVAPDVPEAPAFQPAVAATGEGKPDDPRGSSREMRETGSYAVAATKPVVIVLFRPSVLRPDGPTRVTDEERDLLMRHLGSELALSIAVRELPWVEDPLAILASDVAGPDDPRVPLLLENMSRAAALTPGLEAALWVALVPTLFASEPGPEAAAAFEAAGPRLLNPGGFETHVPAEAARALAVCDAAGMIALLRALPSLADTRPTMQRLRLVGALAPDGTVTLEPAREEPQRAAGPGAGNDSGVVAVALDADGLPLSRVPVRTVRLSENAAFVLLFPVSPDVEVIQFRKDRRVIAELRRPAGRPSLTGFGVDPEAPTVLHWTFSHSEAARPSLQLELVDGTATFAFTADPCFSRIRLPVQRLPPRRQLGVQLVATDGWNAQVSDSVVVLGPQSGTLIVRRVTGAQWWADTNLAGPLTWTLDGKQLTPIDSSVGRLIRLGSEARGVLQVSGLDPETGALLSDSRRLGDVTDG